MMDLMLMRSLLAVAESGAITEAAKNVGISQPALSRRILQLEEHLGAQLLERSRQGAVLTDMGRLAAREGHAMVERYERLRASIAAHLHHEVGSVRLGGGATAVSFLLPRAIASFQQRYPGLLFQMKEAGSLEIERDVAEERLEIGIVTAPVHGSELVAKPLYDDRIVLVAGAGHPLAKGKTRTVGVQALQGQGLVGFEANSAIRRLIDQELRQAGVEMNVVMELRSIAAILRMVATTQNLAFVSELGLGDGRRVRALKVRGLQITRSLVVIQKRGRPPSPAAAAFLAMLERTLR
jgi:molybdate transport repressor ModE-like protein